MLKRRLLICPVFIYMLLIFHCAGLFRTSILLVDMPVDQLVQEIENNAEKVQTFQAEGRFLAVSEETSMGGGIRVFAKMPDSLWIKVEGPLGVDVATGWFNGSEAIWYVPMDGVVFSGSIERIRDLDIIPVDMGSSNLIMGIVGLAIPDMQEQDGIFTLKTDKRQYILQNNGERVYIHPKGPVVTQWEMVGFEGDLLWKWEGENLKKDKGVRFPGTIRFTRWQPKERITIFYEEIKINKPLRQSWFKVNVPEGVRKIEL